MDLKPSNANGRPSVHVSDWSQAPRATKLLAAAVIMLVLLGVYLIHLSDRQFELQGPGRVAENSTGAILVTAYEKLFLIDKQQRVAQLAASNLGLTGPITSVTPDGEDWILGDDDSGLLYRCSALLKDCKPLIANLHGERVFSRAHGVALLGDQINVSDSERHRLRIFDAAKGQLATTRTAPIELCYPNDVVVVDDLLYVTDTNNFRITRIDPQKNYRSETFIQTSEGAPVTIANCADISSRIAKHGDAYGNLILDTTVTVGRPAKPPARARRILPASLLHTSRGEWWVVQMKNMMTLGDAIIYGSDSRAIKRVALPEDSDPTNLIETRDGVLITDPTLSRIYSVDLDGNLRGDWGSDELKGEFQSILESRARWKILSPIGWTVIGLGLIFGLIVIIREIIRTKGDWNAKTISLQPTIATPTPLNTSDHWLSVRTDIANRSRRTFWIGILSVIAFFAIESFLLVDIASRLSRRTAWHFDRFLTTLTIAVLAAGVLALWSVVIATRRLAHMRIGTNGQNLLFDPGNGKIIASEFSQVLVSGRTLLLDTRFVRTHTKSGKPIYEMAQFEALILARIPRQNFVNRIYFAYQGLRRGSPVAWSVLLLLSFTLAVRILPLFFPSEAKAILKFIKLWLTQ